MVGGPFDPSFDDSFDGIYTPSTEVQETGESGLELTWKSADASNGDAFVNDGRTYIAFKCDYPVSEVLTFVSTLVKENDLDVEDVSFTLGENGYVIFGPFPIHIFNDEGGNVNIEYSGPDAAWFQFAVIRPTTSTSV